MTIYGLDGFRRGWVAVGLGAGEPTIAFPGDITWLADLSFDRAMIDMPIGLPDAGLRRCDVLARMALRPHGSRVFTGGQRLWLACADYTEANKRLRAQGHSGISLQLWGLRGKIASVDTFIRQHPRADIREAHPELVFQRLNGGSLPSKHDADGLRIRRNLLVKTFPAIDRWLAKDRIGTGAKADDVLDACACAIAARDHAHGHCLPPSEPERDPHGIPMQIWF